MGIFLTNSKNTKKKPVYMSYFVVYYPGVTLNDLAQGNVPCVTDL